MIFMKNNSLTVKSDSGHLSINLYGNPATKKKKIYVLTLQLK